MWIGDRFSQFYLIVVLAMAVFWFSPNQLLVPIGAEATVTGIPLPSGYNDWVITQNTTVQDEVIILNGSVVINGPYNLTLRNVTLKFNCTSNGEHNLTVSIGGALYLDNCTVTAYDPPNVWFMEGKAGSTILLNDSTFSYAGYDYGHPGVEISSNNAKITYCSFENVFRSPYIFHADNVHISNCLIKNTTKHGIFLESSENGTIINNTVIENGEGAIVLSESPNSIVNGNSITGTGIGLHESGNSTISHNTIIDSSSIPIGLEDSDNSTVSDNTITNASGWGIRLINCSNSTVNGNTLADSAGFNLGWHSNNSLVSNNTITGSWTGILLSYVSNITVSGNTITHGSEDEFVAGDGFVARDTGNIKVIDNTITDIPGVGIRLSRDSGNSTVSGNTLTKANTGIRIFQSGGSVVSSNIISNILSKQGGLYPDGIFIDHSSNSTVSDNTIIDGPSFGIRFHNSGKSTADRNTIAYGSGSGLYLSNSSHSVVSDNTFTNNSRYGIEVVSDTAGCMLWGNVLTANGQLNAIDHNGGNQWDNGSHGNWWADYSGPDLDHNGIGDIPYSIPGETGAQDRYPLVNLTDISPPTIVSPSDVTFKEGTTDHIITWDVSDANPYWYNISRNGSLIVESVWNGSLIRVDVSDLAAGTYVYTLVVYDRLGSSAIDEVHVTVTSGEEQSSEPEKPSEDKGSSTEIPSFGVFTVMLGMLAGILVTRCFKPRKKSLGIG